MKENGMGSGGPQSWLAMKKGVFLQYKKKKKTKKEKEKKKDLIWAFQRFGRV